MNLQDAWNDLGHTGNGALEINVLPAEPAPAQTARAVLHTLKRRMQLKLYFNIAIPILLIPLFWLARDHVFALIGLSFYALLCLASLWLVAHFYRRLDPDPHSDQPLLPYLRHFRDLQRQAVRIENRYGGVFVMLSPGIGAMYGYTASGEHSWDSLFTDHVFLLMLVGVTVVIGPLGVWLSNWMNQKAFGTYLDQLDELIAELEDTDG